MGGRERWVVLMVTVLMVTETHHTELQCDRECSCQIESINYDHKYNVMCNATTLQEATVTRQLLAGMSDLTSVATPRTLIKVVGDPSLTLTITLDFLLQWRKVAACSLEVVGAGNVIFPANIPPFTTNKTLEHYYAGITLTEVAVGEVPANLFSGKAVAVLRLNSSTVGRLSAGLLKGATSLGRLHIVNSTVGVIEGLQGGVALSTDSHLKERTPVLLHNTTVGLLSAGAIHLRVPQGQKVVLREVTVARVDSEAVQVEGGKVVVEQCLATRVEAAALLLEDDAHLTLKNNWLVLQPKALTHLPCGQGEHQVYDNHFSVLDNDTGLPVSLAMQHRGGGGGEGGEGGSEGGEQDKEEVAERKRLTAILSTVIHPSCVSHNLAPLPSPPLWSSASPGHLATFAVIGLCVGLVVASLALLSLQRYRRRRRQRHVKPPTVVMSQLSDQPVHSDTPPEIPPFPRSLQRRPSQDSFWNAPAASCRGEDRTHGVGRVKVEENGYATITGR